MDEVKLDMGKLEDSSTPNASQFNAVMSANRSPLDRRRFSTASILTLASQNTILPQYAATDDTRKVLEDPPVYLPSDADHNAESNQNFTSIPSPSSRPILPNQHSLINPRYSTLLSWINGPNSAAIADSEVQHKFQYSYPIKNNKPWATLHLYTRDAIPGNPRPSKSQPKVPRFWSCDPIAGMVELDLDSPQTIQQIIIVVCRYLYSLEDQ